MDENQFDLLIQALKVVTITVVEKLEEIRCGNIDVETEINKLRSEIKCVLIKQ